MLPELLSSADTHVTKDRICSGEHHRTLTGNPLGIRDINSLEFIWSKNPFFLQKRWKGREKAPLSVWGTFIYVMYYIDFCSSAHLSLGDPCFLPTRPHRKLEFDDGILSYLWRMPSACAQKSFQTSWVQSWNMQGFELIVFLSIRSWLGENSWKFKNFQTSENHYKATLDKFQ